MDFQETNGIQTGSGIKLVIYGQEGVGKSSLAAGLRGQHIKNERPAAAEAHQLGDVAAGIAICAGISCAAAVSDGRH